MIDIVGTLADVVLALRTASATMLWLRLGVLVSGSAAVAWAWFFSGGFWLSGVLLGLAAVAVLGSVVLPSATAPTAVIGVLALDWLFDGRVPMAATVVFAALLALFHALVTLACRGPLYAAVRPGALSLRSWLAWGIVSLLGIGLVVAAASVPTSLVPRGPLWIVVAVAVGLGALIGVLGGAARRVR